MWPFDRLLYSDFSNNTTFPPEHAIEGVVNRCFEYVFGIYKEKEPSKRQYKKKKLDDGILTPAFVPIYRPSYHATKPPYSCTAAEYKRCRAWLKCVLIPIGVTDRSDWFLDIKLYSMFKINFAIEDLYISLLEIYSYNGTESFLIWWAKRLECCCYLSVLLNLPYSNYKKRWMK